MSQQHKYLFDAQGATCWTSASGPVDSSKFEWSYPYTLKLPVCAVLELALGNPTELYVEVDFGGDWKGQKENPMANGILDLAQEG